MALTDFFKIEDSHDLKVMEFINNMNMLKSMSVEEHTLYKKWSSLNHDFNGELSNLRIVKNKIWKPSNILDSDMTINEINKVTPKIILVDDENLLYDWTILREFSHTMVYDGNIGRNLKFLVIDESNDKYIGIISIASDVMAIRDRDSYIGWNSVNKIDNKKINNISICSCIMGTQPFGYNFLGGKLVAALSTSKSVRDAWENKYIDKLVGFTTTSLYGSYSMYNGIPYWKSVGKSTGKILIKPDTEVYEYMCDYVKNKHKDVYNRITTADNSLGVPSGLKQKQMALILKEVGLSLEDYKHGYMRGVYFAPIYKNTNDFLCEKIKESDLIIEDKYKSDIDGIVNWWRSKATNRYLKLHKENRLNNDVLFYDELIGMSWVEAKEKYLNIVGR